MRYSEARGIARCEDPWQVPWWQGGRCLGVLTATICSLPFAFAWPWPWRGVAWRGLLRRPGAEVWLRLLRRMHTTELAQWLFVIKRSVARPTSQPHTLHPPSLATS